MAAIAANDETPATRALDAAGVSYRIATYEHDADATDFGAEAACLLGADPEAIFKTLVVKLDGGRFGVCILPVPERADMRAVARALGASKAKLSTPDEAHDVTGYVIGGVSPFGQREELPMVLDDSANALAEVFVSAGRYGFDAVLSPSDLVRVTGAVIARVRV